MHNTNCWRSELEAYMCMKEITNIKIEVSLYRCYLTKLDLDAVISVYIFDSQNKKGPCFRMKLDIRSLSF